MSLTVYKSSAGSGKTFTLVKEYISIAIKNPTAFRSILAITFTNKAATEMKSRILEYLSGLASKTTDEEQKMVEVLRKDLKSVTGFDDDKIQQRAEIVLKNILHGYSNFAVSTIDSFVHRLVRNFARELELPVNFDVEMDQDKLISKSIDMLLSRVGLDDSLTRTLVKFVESRMEDERSWDVERDLKKITKVLMKESSLDAIKSIRDLGPDDFLKIHKKLNEIIRIIEKKITDPAQQGLKLIQEKNIQPEEFYRGKNGLYGYFLRIARNDFKEPIPAAYVFTMLEKDNWISGKCSASSASAIEALKPQLTGLIDDITAAIGEHLHHLRLCQLINQNIFPLAVLSEIEQMMQEFRENENLVHISEFNKRISNIIGGEPVPFIYERIGEKYRHFMVDEFQDTSILQWQNLLPLYENSLAANHFNMIVGDGKQAIYRWRNGEVEQFAALPEIYYNPGQILQPDREMLLKQHFEEKFLKVNYRSKMEIVDFNNQFFQAAAQKLSDNLRKIYHEHTQEFDAQNSGGQVHVEFLTPLEDAVQEELHKVLELVEDFSREFALNEITILTRSNRNATDVARHLLENGHSVVTSEALMLSSSEEVRFIINIMYYLSFPDDAMKTAEILVYLIRKSGLPYSDLHKLFSKSIEIHPNKQGAKSLKKILQEDLNLELDWQKINQLNLYELVNELVGKFRLDPEDTNAFILFFKDTVLKFSSKNEEVVTDFLEYWEDEGHKDSIIIPEKTEAVRVMTIHKAKGLQFPVVIFPFTGSNNMLGQDEIWIEPELEDLPQLKSALVKTSKPLEETKFSELRKQEVDKTFLDQLNVLYVAMTRPKERLVVLVQDKHKKDGSWLHKSSNPDIADLFYDFLQNNQLWENQKSRYIFGSTGRRIAESSSMEIVDEVKPYDTNIQKGNWKNNVSVRFSSLKNWDIESSGGRRDFGVMVHNILASIRTPDDIPRAVKRAVIEGVLDGSMQQEVEKEIGEIIADPKIKHFFNADKEIITEKDIILTNGNLIRPDRVVLDDHETSVIDYKTGLPKEEHRQQLDDYAGAIGEMGYSNIRKYLIYLRLEAGDLQVVDWV